VTGAGIRCEKTNLRRSSQPCHIDPSGSMRPLSRQSRVAPYNLNEINADAECGMRNAANLLMNIVSS
jgi:hypothetical protein